MIGLCSVLGYFGQFHQVLELANHFRLQYWLGALLSLLAMAWLKRWCWSGAAAALLVLNSFHLAPWFFPAANAGQTTGQRLKVLQSNVKYSSTQYDKVLAYIAAEAPDIVTLQEVDRNWLNNLAALQTTYPYFQFEAEAKGSGIALYSKIKPEKLERNNLGLSWRPGIQIDLKLGETLVHLVTIHPPTPTEPPNFRARNQQFAAVAEHLVRLPAPKILIGDFNDTVWSTYHRQLLAQTQLVNARQGFGLLPSWPSWLGVAPLMIPIDQCLLSPEIVVTGIKTGKNIGSDHLPLVVELVVPNK